MSGDREIFLSGAGAGWEQGARVGVPHRRGCWWGRRNLPRGEEPKPHIVTEQPTLFPSSSKRTRHPPLFTPADDLRINLWSLDAAPQAFTVVDIKPGSMEDLTEVITRAAFHPRDGSLFAYSTSRGSLRLADLRASALCDAGGVRFEDSSPGGPKNFFSEIVSSISDFRFVGDGRLVVARDFMTVKVWDLAQTAQPLETYKVHEALRSRVRPGLFGD